MRVVYSLLGMLLILVGTVSFLAGWFTLGVAAIKLDEINAACREVIKRNGLANTSKTPGRTQLLNCFAFPDGTTMVDCPGYGYAKAPKHEVKAWQSVLRGYLRGRPGLTRAFVLIDSRHGILKADEEMFDLLDEAASRLRIENDSMPAELDEVRRRIMQLEIEREALKLAAILERVVRGRHALLWRDSAFQVLLELAESMISLHHRLQ